MRKKQNKIKILHVTLHCLFARSVWDGIEMTRHGRKERNTGHNKKKTITRCRPHVTLNLKLANTQGEKNIRNVWKNVQIKMRERTDREMRCFGREMGTLEISEEIKKLQTIISQCLKLNRYWLSF